MQERSNFMAGIFQYLIQHPIKSGLFICLVVDVLLILIFFQNLNPTEYNDIPPDLNKARSNFLNCLVVVDVMVMSLMVIIKMEWRDTRVESR